MQVTTITMNKIYKTLSSLPVGGELDVTFGVISIDEKPLEFDQCEMCIFGKDLTTPCPMLCLPQERNDDHNVVFVARISDGVLVSNEVLNTILHKACDLNLRLLNASALTLPESLSERMSVLLELSKELVQLIPAARTPNPYLQSYAASLDDEGGEK